MDNRMQRLKDYLTPFLGREVLAMDAEADRAVTGIFTELIPGWEDEDERADSLMVRDPRTGCGTRIFLHELTRFLPLEQLNDSEAEYTLVTCLCRGEGIRFCLDWTDEVRKGDRVLLREDHDCIGEVLSVKHCRAEALPCPPEELTLLRDRLFPLAEPEYDSAPEHTRYPCAALSVPSDPYPWLKDWLRWMLKPFGRPGVPSDLSGLDDLMQEELPELEELCGNQLEQFFLSLQLGVLCAENDYYDRGWLDTYRALRRLYWQGSFEPFLLCPETEKPLLEEDMRTVDRYLTLAERVPV